MSSNLPLNADGQLSLDELLGGKVTIAQPRRGYRAGVDAVLLAASVDARPGQAVLDLGCGVGAVSLCLAARIGDLVLSGVEIQTELMQLAQNNAERNQVDMVVCKADIADLPKSIRQRQYDHVIANPPYFETDGIQRIENPVRDLAHRLAHPLSLWVSVAAKRLAPHGQCTMINRIERLPDMLAACHSAKLGAVKVLPIAARVGAKPDRFIIRAQKDRTTPFTLLPTQAMHLETRNSSGGSPYRPDIEAVLRHAHALAGW